MYLNPTHLWGTRRHACVRPTRQAIVQLVCGQEARLTAPPVQRRNGLLLHLADRAHLPNLTNSADEMLQGWDESFGPNLAMRANEELTRVVSPSEMWQGACRGLKIGGGVHSPEWLTCHRRFSPHYRVWSHNAFAEARLQSCCAKLSSRTHACDEAHGL